MRSIKASELYKANPAVEVDSKTVLLWKRAFYAIKSLSVVAEDTIRIKGVKNILQSINTSSFVIKGVGKIYKLQYYQH